MALVSEIVSNMVNVPWGEVPEGAIRNDLLKAIEVRRTMLETKHGKDRRLKPVAKSMGIDFNCDAWDFGEASPNLSDPSKARILFRGIESEYKNAVKFWAINELMDGMKPATVKLRVASFRKVLNDIGMPYSTITSEDIVYAIESSGVKLTSQHVYISGIIPIVKNLIEEQSLLLPIDVDALYEFKKKLIRMRIYELDEFKLPNIPAEYHRLILDKAIQVMRNKREDPSMRAIACEIIMLSQLGLRRGDLMRLKTDALRGRRLLKSGKHASYIHFTMEKNSQSGKTAKEFDIACNELCAEAFKTLLKVRNAFDGADETDFLYLTGDCALPAAPIVWAYRYKKFLYAYLRKECTHPWPGIEKSLVYVAGEQKYETVWAPKSGQFRVFLCTSLYEQNVSSQYIMQHMGHLSEFMEGYYNRPKDHGQENADYAAQTLKQIIGEEDLRPLGSMGDRIKEGLEGIIDEVDPRVERDFAEIIKSCEGKVAIRAKLAGVCIKSSRIPCFRDVQTDKAMCAFGICPNLFHFYYYIDISWRDFCTVRDAYEHNVAIGRRQAAKKELNKLEDLVRRRLIPELDELEVELGRRSVAYILEKHPQLSEIIPIRQEIRKEAELWLEK